MFNMDDGQKSKLAQWKLEQEQKVVEKQQKNSSIPKQFIPYYGAVDGGYTYKFTPTSLGVVLKIQNNVTQEEIDLTDYDMW